MEKKGVFMVSVDVELIWGFNHMLFTPEGRAAAQRLAGLMEKRSRRNIPLLLDLSSKYEVPFTWAVVGHLGLESCRCENGKAHPDMPRPEGFSLGDWYAHDPCSSYREAPLWYAPDIVEELVDAGFPQDIGCHAFSHVNFHEASAMVARAEAAKCREVLRGYGVEPRSFVYPRNKVAHVDVLRGEGFTAYRFKVQRKLPVRRKLAYKVADLLNPVTGKPLVDRGVAALPGTMLYQTPRPWEVKLIVEAAKRGVKAAARRGEVFHISFHDYLESDALIDGLAEVLRLAAQLRENGLLETLTMADYASRLLSPSSSHSSLSSS